MARIPMTGGFTLIPEGVHVFRIYDVTYDETFGKLEVKLVNAKGLTMTERFSLKDSKGQANEGALGAFSFLAKTALNNFSIEDVDPVELIDCYIKAEVKHNTQPNKNDPTKTVTFANLGDKSPADGFEESPVDKALTLGKENAEVTTQTTAKSGLDLDSLLG